MLSLSESAQQRTVYYQAIGAVPRCAAIAETLVDRDFNEQAEHAGPEDLTIPLLCLA